MKRRVSVPLWSAAFLASLGLAPLAACNDDVTEEDGENNATNNSQNNSQNNATNNSQNNATNNSSGVDRCANATPILVGGEDTGFDRCEGDYMRRREVKECPNLLPRDGATCGDGNPDLHACHTDADCAGTPNAYCTSSFAENCTCVTGCTKDSDCGDDAVCVCGDPIGYCAPSNCASDDDCEGDFLCSSYLANPFCGPTSFGCQQEADECAGPNDCPDGESCTSEGGPRICAPGGCAIGRPFLVEGEERMAEPVERADWMATGFTSAGAGLPGELRRAIAEHWTQVGLMEHASVAAFARFAMQLMSLGAPPELVMLTQQAMADETQHALQAFGLASAVGGRPVGPGPLCIEGGLEDNDARAIVGMLLREGCVGETVAALEAAEALAHAYDPGVRAVLEKITRDEQAHAALAWKSLRWILEQHPHLASWARAELDEALRQYEHEPSAELSHHDRDALAWGVVSPSLRAKLRQEAIAHLVRPAAAQVLPVSHTAVACA